ncbi:MAG: glycosyl hydrolase [Oscillospiraceae bacterium]
MKKFLSAALAAVMLAAMAGCSEQPDTSSDTADTSGTVVSADESNADASGSSDSSQGTNEITLSNPVAMTEDGDVDMSVALSYQTDYDALIASLNERSVDPGSPVSQNLNEKSREVFDYLRSVYGKQIISAQQMMNRDCLEDIVYYNATGDMPAIKGFDFIFSTGSYPDHYMIDEAIKWHEESGGLVTFTWHWNVPRDINDENMGIAFYQKEIINFDPLNATTPGTKEYEVAVHDIDLIASQLQRLESAGVTVLFRPLHEASGSWFWWGVQNKQFVQNETYQRLWYMIYDRLENYHKLTNLIWVWNGQSEFCYVHPNTYDIAGIDYYANSENHTACVSQYNSLSNLNEKNYKKYLGEDAALPTEPYSGKMLALSECGYIPDPKDCVDTGCMWLYYMIWNGDFVYKASGGSAITTLDGTPSPNEERMTNEMLVEYFANEAFISYKDLPAAYLEGKAFPQRIRNWEYFRIE